MERLDTSQARTDLYKVGEGSDQVFDPTIGIHIADRQLAEKNRKAAAKAKQEQENLDDINAQLKGMQGKAIMSHDTPLVAQKSQAIIDYTRKNIDKLKSGDINTKLGFDQIMADLQQTTAQSVDKRQKVEQTAQMLAANPDKYRPDSITNLGDFISSKHAGDMNFNPAEYVKENVDLNKDFKENLRPQLEDVAQGGTFDYVNPETGVKTTITKDNLTKDQVTHFLKDRLADHKIYDQAHYDLSKSSEATQEKYKQTDGSLDVNQYYIDRMLPYAQIQRNKITTSEPSAAGQKEEESKQIHTEISNDAQGNTVIVPRTKTGKQLSIIKGGVTYTLSDIKTDETAQPNKTIATGTRTLNKQELDQNKAAVAANKIRETNIEQAKLQLDKETITPEEFSLIQAKNIPKELPYKNDEIETTFGYDKIHDILEHNQPKEGAQKLNMYNLLKGDVPKGFTIDDKRQSTSTNYTIKGKPYTLKQLTDLGYTPEQVAQYKSK